MLKLPRFPFKGNVPIVVSITEGITEGGAPNVTVIFDGVCHFDEKSKTIRGKDNIDVRLSGVAIIDGDIVQTIDQIPDSASIDGSKPKKINAVRRIRDLSGSVHHTELELI